jgi:hypothetical protein
MDQPLVTFELRSKYLLVVGHGRRDTLTEMNQSASIIYQRILETNTRYMLVDYRQLYIGVHLGEAFNIVKRYEVALPELKQVTIATVFSGQGWEFGQYWKEVSQRRGFLIEIFQDMAAAEEWLLEQVK